MEIGPLVLPKLLGGSTLGPPEAREGRVMVPGRPRANFSVGAMPDGVGALFWSLGSVPEGVALVFPTATAPIFELPGVTSIGATPIPLKAMVCGFVRAVSVILSVAVRIPSAEGVNVTVIRQVSPGPSVLGPRGQPPPAT